MTSLSKPGLEGILVHAKRDLAENEAAPVTAAAQLPKSNFISKDINSSTLVALLTRFGRKKSKSRLLRSFDRIRTIPGWISDWNVSIK